MNYFIREYEREGTAYVCFRKGPWNGSSAWEYEKESMLIEPDEIVLCGLYSIFEEVIPEFDIYGCAGEVSLDEWEQIYAKAMARGGEAKLAIEELCEWAWENFERWDVFCIVGV